MIQAVQLWHELLLVEHGGGADLSLYNFTFSFVIMFVEIQLQRCEDLNFVSRWNTTMMMNKAKAMLTEVYTTLVWP